MTEKRFTVNYRENTRLYEVKDNLHIIDCGGFAIEYSAKKCCEELNALYDENEQLKKEFKLTAKRFIVDDAGTLIDMQTRDTYDYVSDVCGLLNELHEENQRLRRCINAIYTIARLEEV